MTEELLHVLSGLPLFEPLPGTLVKKMLNGTLPVTVKRGRTVVLQGDTGDSLIIVLSGMIKVYRLFPEGKEIVIRLMTEGDVILTDMGTPENCVYEESFEAIKETKLISISKIRIQECISDHPDIALALLSMASRQTQCLIDEITLLKWQYLPQRVASFLVGLSPESEGPACISLPYEKTLIAARLGASRESLSRTFAELKQVGVEVNHNHVTIQDVEELRRFSETHHHDLKTEYEK